MNTSRAKWLVSLALIVVVVLWAALLREDVAVARQALRVDPQDVVEETVARAAPAQQPEQHDAGVVGAPLPDMDATPVPAARTPAIERVLLEAKYGDAPDRLGLIEPAYGYDGLVYPPQGFAPLGE